ncbi:MAG: hypothetical protein N3E46_08750, partial [Gemmataceae bacterium]|nr:hypothetical protein [Gemmataceae bacterium]
PGPSPWAVLARLPLEFAEHLPPFQIPSFFYGCCKDAVNQSGSPDLPGVVGKCQGCGPAAKLQPRSRTTGHVFHDFFTKTND